MRAHRVVVPSNAAWDDFFDAPGLELGDREPQSAQLRDDF